jgi:D-alanyl-D-alanine carboxypeptidase
LSPLLRRNVSRDSLSWAQGAGGIISTTHDMTVWENALYHGRLLPPKQQEELLSLISTKTGKPIKQTTPSDPGGFALGTAQIFHPQFGRAWFYEGETLGFRVLHVYLPKSNVIYAMGLNSAVAPAPVDQIGDLVISVYKTLVANGVIHQTAL